MKNLRRVGIERMGSIAFGSYLAASGAALLTLLLNSRILESGTLQWLAKAVSSLLPIVLMSCPVDQEARRAFIAILAAMVHASGILALMGIAWTNRQDFMSARFCWPREVRAYTEFVGGGLLAVGLYWHTFMVTPEPTAASSVAASYVCWHPAATWLIFTVRGLLSVVFIGIFGLAVLLVGTGILRRILVR